LPDQPLVAMCAGKDCRTRCEYGKVRAELDRHCELIDLKCVDICAGPVVVVRPTSDSPVVLSKLRSKQHRKHLLGMLSSDGAISKDLRGLAVGKKKREATLRRVRRALERRAA
jgi:hypothetical protein